MARTCDFCPKPAATVVDERIHACAECMALRLAPEDLDDEVCLRWLDQEPGRNGALYPAPRSSLYLPKRFVLEELAEVSAQIAELTEEIDVLEELKRALKAKGLDYGTVGGTDGPGIKLVRQGEIKDGEAGTLMVSQSPLGFGGASEHVTKALYRWLEREKE